MNETPNQDRIADLLRIHGCLVFHARAARTNQGWRTAVKYDGKGYHDLTAISTRTGAVLFIEVKGDGGRVQPDQRKWHQAAAHAQANNTNVHHFVLWPKDWDYFVQWCQRHL